MKLKTRLGSNPLLLHTKPTNMVWKWEGDNEVNNSQKNVNLYKECHFIYLSFIFHLANGKVMLFLACCLLLYSLLWMISSTDFRRIIS